MKMFVPVLAALILIASQAGAQTPAPSPAPYKPDSVIPATDPNAPPKAAQAPINPASYVIGPQDSLTITVLGEDDISGKYRVDEGGGITFPYVGRVNAAGLTLEAFQDRLKTLLEAGYIRRPQLRVDIDQYKSQQVFVMGEVRSPGKITLTGTTMTLLEALAQAAPRTVCL